MAKIKNLRLTNFKGYENIFFDFTHENIINPLSLFFGPNGTGKSTVLEAIQIVSNPKRNKARQLNLVFRRYTHQKNFDPSYDLFEKEIDSGDKERINIAISSFKRPSI